MNRSRTEARRRTRRASLTVETLERRTLLAVTIGTNFSGLNFPDSFHSVPPDTIAAVGPDHVVEVINAAIGIFDKTTGERLFHQSLSEFFAPVDAGSDLFDPVVAYDEQAGRFFVGVLDMDSTDETSFFEFAVSNSSNPLLGFSEMHKLDVRSSFEDGELGWADFPRTGWNADVYVFSFNMFTFDSEVFDHVQVLAIDRVSVLDALALTITTYSSTRDSTHFTLAPATMHDSMPGDPMWLVEEAESPSTVRVTRMDQVLSDSPTFTDTDFAVAKYRAVRHAKQLGGQRLDAQDTRILNAAWRDDRLVATHAVGVKRVTRARWYEFDTDGAMPTLTQSGTIDQGKKTFTYYPAIEIAENGDIAMTFLQSSSREFMSMYVTGRTDADFSNMMQLPVPVKLGEATYSAFDDPPFRAGDYSGITVDPITGTSFWVANEYATSSFPNNWGTWIAEVSISSAAATRTPRAAVVDAALAELDDGTAKRRGKKWDESVTRPRWRERDRQERESDR